MDEVRRRRDVLVNNSVARPMRAYADPLEAWERSMAVNATGVFAISRAFVDRMMERGQGAVVNIGSIQSVVGPPTSPTTRARI